MVKLLLTLLIYMVQQNLDANALYDFCNLKCKNHVLCERKAVNCSPSPNCVEMKHQFFEPSDRQLILDTLNDMRNQVALGKLKFPSAADMQALRWCFELEYFAQCQANTCDFESNFCVDTRIYHVQQYVTSSSSSKLENITNPNWITEEFIENFLDEQNIAAHVIDTNPPNNNSIFDIIACSEVSTVGCGQSTYKAKNNKWKRMVVCNFLGNPKPFRPCPQGSKIYHRGTPCSRCVGTACNKDYPGLCGLTIPVDDELGVRYRASDINNYSIAAFVEKQYLAVLLLCLLVSFCILRTSSEIYYIAS